MTDEQVDKAEGCFLGQIAGDSLGSLVEFRSAEDIKEQYPNGVRELADGGTHNTIAGQPTDDSEMAIIMARSIVDKNGYDINAVLESYRYWKSTEPFDIGFTTIMGLTGVPNLDSQANGALMRVAPIGILGSTLGDEETFSMGCNDAHLTHPHINCVSISGLFAVGIASAIAEDLDNVQLYNKILAVAKRSKCPPMIISVIEDAKDYKPGNFMKNMGWVMIAFQNALYHLVNTDNVEQAIIETVNDGGDTDTNGAIVGALLGAFYGRTKIPEQWETSILSCRPKDSKKRKRVKQPRPEVFWPVDVIELTNNILNIKS
jgi:ADP-ribosyl-[dinitrogen reductase] hydrolase